VCSSAGEEGGAGCSDAEAGELARCGPGDRGCFISRAVSGSSAVYERGCTAVTDEELYTCQKVQDSHGGTSLHYCNCHGPGCNADWSTADTTTCYQCSSLQGACSSTQYGDQVKCEYPANKGCAISETSGPAGSTFIRTCSAEEEMAGFVCSNHTVDGLVRPPPFLTPLNHFAPLTPKA